MAQRLNPHYIAQIYTAEEIRAKITTLEAALTGAAQGGYSFDSGQHRQTVTAPSDVSSVESLLAVYMKAYQIKTGAYTGTQIIAGNYTF